MSVFKQAGGAIIPVRERREVTGTFAGVNAETILPLNGDQYALVTLLSSGFIGTVEFTGASDSAGTGYYPVLAYPLSNGCIGGTILPAGQPILSHAIVFANTQLVYAVPVGQLRNLRVRVTAHTSGSLAITMISDVNQSLNTLLNGTTAPSTLFVSNTAAVSTGLTLTLPAVAGLRHYIDEVSIVRSATAALTASATPVLVTNTNLPGSPVLTFGSDAAGVGIDVEKRLPCGQGGLAASVLGTATTFVMPAWIGVIWRANVAYHLGA